MIKDNKSWKAAPSAEDETRELTPVISTQEMVGEFLRCLTNSGHAPDEILVAIADWCDHHYPGGLASRQRR